MIYAISVIILVLCFCYNIFSAGRRNNCLSSIDIRIKTGKKKNQKF